MVCQRGVELREARTGVDIVVGQAGLKTARGERVHGADGSPRKPARWLAYPGPAAPAALVDQTVTQPPLAPELSHAALASSQQLTSDTKAWVWGSGPRSVSS